MKKDPGKLRHRMTIQKLTAVPDEKCEQQEVWADFARVHCSVSTFIGSEKVQYRQEITDSDRSFTVRWSKKLSVLNEQDYRIVYGGEVYDIKFIKDPQDMHEELIISAKKAVHEDAVQ